MREQKFRTWYDKSQTWIYFTVGKIIPTTEQRKVYNEQCVIGRPWYEYIGLQDKNGNDIYEGDMVEINNGKRYLVKWGEYGFHFYWVTDEVDSIGTPRSSFPNNLFTNKKGKLYAIIVGNICEKYYD